MAAALVAAAWFAVGARQAIDTSQATAIVQSSARLAPEQARRADALLHSAGFLNPDRQVLLLRSQVALASGDRTGAHRLAAQLTRAEPRNADAWVQLARSSSRAGFFRALKRVGALVPPVKPGH